MAEESDLERTEPATPKRLEKAREEGQVARSQELTTFALLMVAAAGLLFFGYRHDGKTPENHESWYANGTGIGVSTRFDAQSFL